jgi:hypothetical protein
MRRLWAAVVAIVVCLALGGMPAAGQESTGEPAVWTEASVEVLNDAGVIPLEAIPEDADHITFARIVIEPGVSGEGPSYQPQRWTNLEYADQGWTRGTSAERMRFWHADGTTVDVPAGAPQDQAAGDVALYYNGAAPGTFENPGADTYVSYFLGVGNSLDPETGSASPPGLDWQMLDYIFPLGPNALDWFSAPIAVSYLRITWEPGDQLVLGPDEVPMLSFIWLESGTLKSGEMALDEVSGAELSETVPTRWTYRQETPPDGTVYVLRNEGDEPAVGMAAVLSHPSDT